MPPPAPAEDAVEAPCRQQRNRHGRYQGKPGQREPVWGGSRHAQRTVPASTAHHPEARANGVSHRRVSRWQHPNRSIAVACCGGDRRIAGAAPGRDRGGAVHEKHAEQDRTDSQQPGSAPPHLSAPQHRSGPLVGHDCRNPRGSHSHEPPRVPARIPSSARPMRKARRLKYRHVLMAVLQKVGRAVLRDITPHEVRQALTTLARY
jgi:hypothetical protein